jgi:hypothetical protein
MEIKHEYIALNQTLQQLKEILPLIVDVIQISKWNDQHSVDFEMKQKTQNFPKLKFQSSTQKNIDLQLKFMVKNSLIRFMELIHSQWSFLTSFRTKGFSTEAKYTAEVVDTLQENLHIILKIMKEIQFEFSKESIKRT